MVEFIILGQIPGTNVYLSFTAVGIVAIVAAVISGIATTNQLRAAKQKTKEQLAIQQQAI